MACDSCNKSEPVTPAAAMTYAATASSVVGKDGVRYQINKSLIPAGRKPTGGWKVSLLVNGQFVTADGGSAEAVHAEAARLLKLNGAVYSDLDLWLNLNIQWLQRLAEKFQVVRERDLMSVASGSAVPPEHARPVRAPEDRLDPVDDCVARVDVDACILVGQAGAARGGGHCAISSEAAPSRNTPLLLSLATHVHPC